MKLFVERYSPERIYVLFSGGKDSTAALAAIPYAGESIAKRAVVVYNEITGNTARMNVEQVRRILEKLGFSDIEVVQSPPYTNITRAVERGARALHIVARGRRGETFWEAVEKWGLPLPRGSRRARWCKAEFKDVHWEHLPPVTGTTRYIVVGVKAADSPFRRKLWQSEVREFKWKRGVDIALSPIYDMSTEEVWQLLREAGLEKQLETYRLCGDSLNCAFCPMRSPRKQRGIIQCLVQREPQLVERALQALRKLRNPPRVAQEWLNEIQRALGQRQVQEETA